MSELAIKGFIVLVWMTVLANVFLLGSPFTYLEAAIALKWSFLQMNRFLPSHIYRKNK